LDPARYFDNAATTRLDPAVWREMEPYFGVVFGNANSIHQWGQRAAAGVDRARERVAETLGCSPEQVFFTSGATESNNWVLRSFERVAVSPFEHSSAWETAQTLGHTVLGNDGYSLLAPNGGLDLVCVMAVNNETGAILTLPQTSALVHRDATQALGKVPLGLAGVDFASFSAHKVHGPKGVGGLFAADPTLLRPMLIGGGQEHGLRAGTVNVPGVVGLGAACALAMDRRDEALSHVQSLRDAVLEGLAKVPDCWIHDGPSNSPYILSVSVLGLHGESLALYCDQAGFAVSSGAACSSGSTEPSHVLTALGVPESAAKATVRVSFSIENSLEAAQALARTLAKGAEELRRLGP
jgi:cysteine desulfurase